MYQSSFVSNFFGPTTKFGWKKRVESTYPTMVDTARQLLDELMGRNRNLDPITAKNKKVQWDDPEASIYIYSYM